MRKFNLIAFIATIIIVAYACGNQGGSSSATASEEKPKSMVQEPESYDPKRGEGKFSADNVKIGDKLDETLATTGEKISATKCTSCHKTSNQKLVGPGWAGVTTRRKPEWIMNFITNPDPMINKDPEAKAMMEICLVRMPNQNLTDDDARALLEFMRKNDGVK